MGIVLGMVLAMAAVFLVVEPLWRAATGRAVTAPQPLFSDSDDEEDPVLARRDRALAALKEIDFDRATGKLSDADYEKLKADFTAEALDAMKAADRPAVPPSPHPADDPVEALIAAARTGANGSGRFCLECGSPLGESRRFCLECGTPIGARLP